ncbi:MAG: recombinase family protein [Desulfovibrio sp.]|nr:recombinase family protein [Desulfovibrio sp.]
MKGASAITVQPIPQNFVAYYRVSTAKQGKSGLGIEAQRDAVAQYVGRSGGTVLASFQEVESGKRADRPQLALALERCRLTRSTLVVAKLDRLTRDTNFLAKLRDSGVPFVACDNPHANALTVTILIAVAEEERRLASVRTREALARAKARGKKLGCPLGAAAFGDRRGHGATEALKAKADRFARSLASIVQPLLDDGLSLRKIADKLNGQGIVTAQGKLWQANSVKRLAERLQAMA